MTIILAFNQIIPNFKDLLFSKKLLTWLISTLVMKMYSKIEDIVENSIKNSKVWLNFLSASSNPKLKDNFNPWYSPKIQFCSSFYLDKSYQRWTTLPNNTPLEAKHFLFTKILALFFSYVMFFRIWRPKRHRFG